jgi:hypothetical protein
MENGLFKIELIGLIGGLLFSQIAYFINNRMEEYNDERKKDHKLILEHLEELKQEIMILKGTSPNQP